MTQQVFCIINANAEGYNLIGIYDTQDEADKICKQLNLSTRQKQERLNQTNYGINGGGTLDFTESDWDDCHVVAWKINSRKPFVLEDFEDD